MPRPSAPALASSVLAALAGDDDYASAPHWAGQAVETGALARCADHAGLRAFVAVHGNGVAARLLARLTEVARTVVDLAAARVEPRVAAWSPQPGEGVASTQTARGLLLHRAQVAAGRVTGYAIVAPTEWNFHPQGALVRGLEGLACDDERALRRCASLVVQSLDPCVTCAVEIARA
jgi:Ni,Fe-hydrogenase I large subunit